MLITVSTTKNENILLEQPPFKMPFVVSLSNHERPFDRPAMSLSKGSLRQAQGERSRPNFQSNDNDTNRNDRLPSSITGTDKPPIFHRRPL